MTYKMTDAAYYSPSMLDNGTEAVACYIGGEFAVHVWPYNALVTVQHYPRLPIWVPRSDATGSEASQDLNALLDDILHYGFPRGQTIAFDLETSRADVDYMAEVAKGLQFFGYGAIGYGSLSTINDAVPNYLWKWAADWTDVPHLIPGMEATQWTNGKQFDTSEISEDLYNTLLWKL